MKLSLPFQLGIAIIAALVMQPYMSLTVLQGFYTFSLLFKALLSAIIPLIIFSFIVSGILSFEKNAPIVLGLLIIIIFASNGIVALISYLAALMIVPALTCDINTTIILVSQELSPYFDITIPLWLSKSSVYILFASTLLGIILSWKRVQAIEVMVEHCKTYIENFITYIFLPLLPIYVFGFMLKIGFDGTFELLFRQYGSTCLLIVFVQFVYLACFYLLAAGFSWQQAWRYIKTAAPSYITAFSTMSSTAAIPVTVKAAEKNSGNTSLARMSVPIMANVHLLGDSVATPLLALVTLIVFKGCLPSFATYMVFVASFCIAMFGAAGIPGGGIIVMLPVLKTYFGFTGAMSDLVMSLYFLMDPFGTAANVMGDGALVIIVNKVLRRLRLSK